MHRIDKDTSGLIIIAKNNLSHLKLSEQFKNHTIDRVYLALVWGKIKPRSGRIENFIKRSVKNRQLMEVSLTKGKKAQSPFDNSIDDPDKIIKIVKKYFRIIKLNYSDAFIDKLIGGLRGKNRFVVAKFLKKYDQYLVDNKILNGTNLFLEAKIK